MTREHALKEERKQHSAENERVKKYRDNGYSIIGTAQQDMQTDSTFKAAYSCLVQKTCSYSERFNWEGTSHLL